MSQSQSAAESSLVQRALQRLAALRSPSPVVRVTACVVAALLFAIGSVVCWAGLDVSDFQLRWDALIKAAFLGVPLMSGINGLRMQMSFSATGQRASFFRSWTLASVATAANMLPLPGGALVRLHALQQGAGWRVAMSTTTALSAVWIGAGLLATALSVAWLKGADVSATITAAFGLLAMSVGCFLLPSGARRFGFVIALLAIEAVGFSIQAQRIVWIFDGIGTAIGFSRGLIFSAAGVVSVAVGIAPGGLGIQELASAALSQWVGLGGRLGFVAAALDRIMFMTVYAPMYLLFSLGLRSNQKSRPHRPRPE